MTEQQRPPQPGQLNPQPPRPQISPLQPPRPVISPGGPPKISPLPSSAPKTQDDGEPIKLIDEPKPGTAPAPSKIKAFSSSSHIGPAAHSYKRQPTTTGQGACRVRSFHGRLSEEGLVFLDDKINEWLDNHPEVEIKVVTTNIGQFEGKVRELAMVINIWY
jgi:hypothetical protein